MFIDPGFPIQKSQLRIIGVQWEEFDIYAYRGAALHDKLESMLSTGEIACYRILPKSRIIRHGFVWKRKNWLLSVNLATKYDVIVMEDLAYFCMDFRRDLGHPFEPPYPPTVAHYTDNYILMLSSSKIFSYAGQRMALTCISDKACCLLCHVLMLCHYESIFLYLLLCFGARIPIICIITHSV